ncbi:putative ribonuclease H-like domain-containing protein, partial [Tanacetum coccineum]
MDYGFNFMNTKIHIDNESTIYIVKNPVYHSKTKHIEIRHHFIRDCYEKKLNRSYKDDSEDSDEVGEQDDSVTGTKIPINPVPVAMKSPSIATYKI